MFILYIIVSGAGGIYNHLGKMHSVIQHNVTYVSDASEIDKLHTVCVVCVKFIHRRLIIAARCLHWSRCLSEALYHQKAHLFLFLVNS